MNYDPYKDMFDQSINEINKIDHLATKIITEYNDISDELWSSVMINCLLFLDKKIKIHHPDPILYSRVLTNVYYYRILSNYIYFYGVDDDETPIK